MVIYFAFRSICTIFAGDMEVISMPVWAWILFYVLVLVMLVIDLKSFGRKGQHEVSVSEALKMTAVWIGVSLIFCGGIWLYEGDEKAMEFLAGYLIEKSLSMDNLFVFLMLFSSVPWCYAASSSLPEQPSSTSSSGYSVCSVFSLSIQVSRCSVIRTMRTWIPRRTSS